MTRHLTEWLAVLGLCVVASAAVTLMLAAALAVIE